MTTLIVAGAPVVDAEAYRSILSSAGMRIAVDSGADLCFKLGWTPDLFVGDADSVSRESLARVIAEDVPRIMLPTDKDQTDLGVALDNARTEFPGPLQVTAILGGRTDHLLVAVGELLGAGDDVLSVVEPTERAWVLSGKGADRLTLAPKGALVSVLAGMSGAEVSLKGFRWELDQASLTPLSARGLSNVITADTATIRVHRGRVLVHTTHLDHGPRAHSVSGGAL